MPSSTSKSDIDHVKREYREWKASQAKRLADIEAMLAISPALRGKVGTSPRMALVSGEISDKKYGEHRVTFFGEDGPHGHATRMTMRQIAEEIRDMIEPPYTSMTEDDVLEWTSTDEFEKGARVIAYVQAENTLRWFASKAGREDWAQDEIKRANQIGTRGGTVNNRNMPVDLDALDEALVIMHSAIRELPTPNPTRPGFVRNPPWVTKALANSYDILDDKVPSRWMPQLASVKAAPYDRVIADLVEFGCGAYGCVLATNDPGTVLKVTSDETEAEFAAKLAGDLVAPICVDYRMVVRLSETRHKRQIHLLWREAADEVGKLQFFLDLQDPTGLGYAGQAADMYVRDQHRAAQIAYDALAKGKGESEVMAAVKEWQRQCEKMARGSVPELRALGKGLVEVYERQHILFGDIHIGNLGLVHRADGDAWVITDPGNVAVIQYD